MKTFRVIRFDSSDLDSFYKTLVEAGSRKVKVTGLGTFWVHRVPARVFKNNLKGGEIIQAKPAIRVKFKPTSKIIRFL